MSHQTIPHRLEKLKNTKIGEKSSKEIGEEIGDTVFLGSRSKVDDVGVTQSSYHRL